MATAAVGDGPVEFFKDDGTQISVPLAAIYFDGDTVKSKVTATGLDEWLKYLVAQGRLAPGDTPPVAEAMVFTAAAAGTTGNTIVVEVVANGDTAVAITVTETNIYEWLTLKSPTTAANFVGKVLGDAANTVVAHPGMVRVQGTAAATTDVPAKEAATQVGTTTAALWEIRAPAPAGGGQGAVLLTLQPRTAGAETGMTIKVSHVDATTKTFTLEVVWEKTVTVQDTDLTGLTFPLAASHPLAALAFSTKVNEPVRNAGLKLPRPGVIKLRGGAEPVDAKPATATLLAKE